MDCPFPTLQPYSIWIKSLTHMRLLKMSYGYLPKVASKKDALEKYMNLKYLVNIE